MVVRGRWLLFLFVAFPFHLGNNKYIARERPFVLCECCMVCVWCDSALRGRAELANRRAPTGIVVSVHITMSHARLLRIVLVWFLIPVLRVLLVPKTRPVQVVLLQGVRLRIAHCSGYVYVVLIVFVSVTATNGRNRYEYSKSYR